ncbi:MAG: Hint domain-containing protein [Paracoccaceae bacterium]|nr:Hint domain-containing protein [Paracoccaceae bacterium]
MATNITWSSLYLGNIADMDTDEGSFTIEDSSQILNTFGSPGSPLYDQVVDITTNSTDDDAVYSDNSTTSDTVSYDLGAGQVVAQVDSLPLMTGIVTFKDGSTLNSSDLSVFQDTNGNIFLTIRDNQPALAAQAIESIQFTAVTESNYIGLTQFTRDDLEFLCFAAGTLILTEGGEVPVEHLATGDRVMTLDHGLQPVRWVSFSDQPLRGVDTRKKPVLIRKDALGTGIPSRDIVVSPQHRILVGGQQQLCEPFAQERLAPAKSLTDLGSVRHMRGKLHISWVHFACDRHEVIRANGCWAESLLLGDMAVAAMSADEVRELEAIFGPRESPEAPWNGVPARALLRTQEVRQRLADHRRKSRRPRPVQNKSCAAAF